MLQDIEKMQVSRDLLLPQNFNSQINFYLNKISTNYIMLFTQSSEKC